MSHSQFIIYWFSGVFFVIFMGFLSVSSSFLSSFLSWIWGGYFCFLLPFLRFFLFSCFSRLPLIFFFFSLLASIFLFPLISFFFLFLSYFFVCLFVSVLFVSYLSCLLSAFWFFFFVFRYFAVRYCLLSHFSIYPFTSLRSSLSISYLSTGIT
ncbi:hypothetical protein BZA77DRAFT_315364 [Pyronema omphalodes]|nr:hypothetical protein BZA77DRAFT_315364 [Pyronema omphalodes]